MSKPDDLLGCPFCGGKIIHVHGVEYAHCRECGATGPHFPSDTKTPAEAIAAWNRRAGQSHTDGLVAALRDMLFIYRNGENVSAEYRVNAVAKADAALTAAKGQQQ